MFKKKRVAITLLAGVMATSMLFSACTVSGSSYPGTKTENTAVINIGAEPPDMFSITTSDSVSGAILNHLNDGLIILDQQDKPIPGVAKDWDISEDELVYTFNLRDDYKWSNGEGVTAKDFEFAFTSLINPEFISTYAYFGYVLKNAKAYADFESYNSLDDAKKAEYVKKNDEAPAEVKIEDVGVKVINDYTLELTLENPIPYFIDMLAFVSFLPVNQKAYEEFGETYGTEADKMAYCGPYILEEWAHDNEMILTKNPDYPMNDQFAIETVDIKMITDTNTSLNSFKGGELDLTEINADQASSLNDEGKETAIFDDASVWYLEFNMNHPVLSNQKIREAISLTLDRETLVKNIIKNESLVATQFTPPAINDGAFYETVGSQFKSYDIEKAQKLLAEGMEELGIENASDIELSYLVDDKDTGKKIAAFFQENLQNDLGIVISVEPVPFGARIDRMNNGDFDICNAGWSPDYNDPMTFLDLFETDGGNNHADYTSEDYDELLNKARTELDKEKRTEYLIQAEELLMDDLPIAPFYFRSLDYVLSDKLEGVVRTGFQDFNLRWATVKSLENN